LTAAKPLLKRLRIEDESDLIERVPYRQGGTKYSVIPGRWNSYGLIGETKYRDVFMLHTGWSSVSRDLSEIEFINETLTSIEDTHREFARKALGLGIESSECKEMLLNAIDSGDSVLRAFSLLGLGYARGWNEYITVFEKGVEDDHPLVRWAAISSLYFPKGPIVRPWAPMKKEAICTNLEGLLKDKARMVREKASFILQHRECSENP